jgi:septal ring factor EnvC (AmiA/AmiB activator)
MMQRFKFMKLIAEQDADLITEVRYHKQALESETAYLTESLSEMAVLRQTRESENKKLESSKRSRQTMLAQIRDEKTEHEDAINELRKAQQEVKNLIGSLEQRRLGKGELDLGDFAKLKGKLIWPVKGKVTRRFGKTKHPKFGTVTFNNGVDIKAASGAPIRSVAPGVVEFVDWIDSYGKCVIVNHGGGYYTLYAHVASTFVDQGQTVTRGEVIAEVGDTGSLAGYECHFEIRHSKQALNPLQWLKK